AAVPSSGGLNRAMTDASRMPVPTRRALRGSHALLQRPLFVLGLFGVVALLAAGIGEYSTAPGAHEARDGGPPRFHQGRVEGADVAREAAADEEAATALRGIASTLAKFPPRREPAAERLTALGALDTVLHDEDAPYRPPVQQFFHDRIERVVAE